MITTRLRAARLAAAALLMSTAALAQNPPGARGRGAMLPDSVREAIGAKMARAAGDMSGDQMGPPGDFGRFLFPPELVMQHQRDLALTDAQRTTITAAIQKLQSDVVPLQWKMTDEQQRLTELARQTPVDSAAMLAQMDKVLDLERQIKRGQVAMLIKIKNTLTPDQQHTLQALMGPPGVMRKIREGEGGGRGARGRGEGGGPPDGAAGR